MIECSDEIVKAIHLTQQMNPSILVNNIKWNLKMHIGKEKTHRLMV
jgi:hypothetical protein